MEWLCKPFVNITRGKIVKILHFGNPHIVHFVQVKDAKYIMKAKGFNRSLINVKEEAKKHLTYRLRIHKELLS